MRLPIVVFAFVAGFVAPLLAIAVRLNVWAGIAVIAIVVTGAVFLRPD